MGIILCSKRFRCQPHPQAIGTYDGEDDSEDEEEVVTERGSDQRKRGGMDGSRASEDDARAGEFLGAESLW